MIREHPLAGICDLQTSSDGGTTWKTWFGAANSVSVQRGGKASGAGVTVDVGTLSATLVNSGDPLTDSTLVPNMPIRLVTRPVGDPLTYTAPVTVYSQGFESFAVNAANPDSWAGSGTVVTGSNANTGTKALSVTSGTGSAFSTRAITGLTVGRSYTFSAWVSSAFNVTTNTAKLQTSLADSGYVAVGYHATGSDRQISLTFTATATSDTLYLFGTGATGTTGFRWDDVTLVQNPYLGIPNPNYIPGVPVFTGNIIDLATSYTLDKNTGQRNTFVVISAADAVNSHANVTRYGAVSSTGIGYETWASRIIRLAASAVMPITPPADDSPVVRYGI